MAECTRALARCRKTKRNAMEHTGSATDNAICWSTRVKQNGRRAAEDEETETKTLDSEGYESGKWILGGYGDGVIR